MSESPRTDREELGFRMSAIVDDIVTGSPLSTPAELTEEFMAYFPAFCSEFLIGQVDCDTDTTTKVLELKYIPQK